MQDNTSGITPTDYRVLVKPDPVEEKSKGGIILADATRERSKFSGTKATLIAIGPNAFKDWGEKAHVQPGARVLFAQYSGARHEGLDGAEYVVMKDEDIICTIEGGQ